MQQLFQVAILFNPTPTKEQNERGEEPKTEMVIEPRWILAKDKAAADVLAARMIPDSHADKVDQLVIAVRPF